MDGVENLAYSGKEPQDERTVTLAMAYGRLNGLVGLQLLGLHRESFLAALGES